jgi:hypothetical protein
LYFILEASTYRVDTFAQDQLEVSIEIDPSQPIMLGRVITLSSQIRVGGIAPHRYGFALLCGQNPAVATHVPNVPTGNPEEPTGQTCANVAGMFEAQVVVTSADNKTGRAQQGFEILAPDRILETPTVHNPSSAGPQAFQTLHLFRVSRTDGDRPVGSCFETAALERIWTKDENGLWQDLPDPGLPEPWEREGISPTQSPAFHYTNSYIVDTKLYTAPANFDIGTVPDGTELFEYKQQLGVRIPVCGQADPTVVKSRVMHFKVIKISIADPNDPRKTIPVVKHELMN